MCGRCRHQRIPRPVVAVILAPSVVVSSLMDLPRVPSPRSSSMIGALGEPSDDDDNNDPAGRASSPGGQSVLNIDNATTSLPCSSSLLVSVVVVVFVFFVVVLKCHSQSWQSAT